MKSEKQKPGSFLICMVWLSMLVSCAAPRIFWPQKDMPAVDRPASAEAPKILVASRSSEFKQALVEKLSALLTAQQVGLKIIGIEALETVDAADYEAVVIINTCLAWGLNKEVQEFIDRQARHDRLVVVTTSAQGDWMPKKNGRDYDALSSASTLTDADAMAGAIFGKIHSIRQKQLLQQ